MWVKNWITRQSAIQMVTTCNSQHNFFSVAVYLHTASIQQAVRKAPRWKPEIRNIWPHTHSHCVSMEMHIHISPCPPHHTHSPVPMFTSPTYLSLNPPSPSPSSNTHTHTHTHTHSLTYLMNQGDSGVVTTVKELDVDNGQLFQSAM